MVKCPCEECIVLAICIYKVQLKCDMLIGMFKGLDQEDDDIMGEVWHVIHKSLPHLSLIGVEPK